jgi:uncharacterized protein (DUF305 family)
MKLKIIAAAIIFAGGSNALLFPVHSYGKETKPKAPQFDAKFLDQMTDHHKDAIEMSELAELRARNPELKKMAERMVADQKEEIDQMKIWREQFFATAPKVRPAHAEMDMSALKGKSGREFDMAFIDLMAKHHEQGINMAKLASDRLFNTEVKSFAQNVIIKQSHERDELKQIKKIEGTQGGDVKK